MTDASVIVRSRRAPAKKHKPAATPKSRAAPRRRRHAPPRTRRVEPEARRQAILKAALEVFAAHGFEAARLDDVAARAGVAKGTLYLYFRDKEALFEALVRNAVSPIMEQMSKVAAAPDVLAARGARGRSSRCSRRRCSAPSASCCCASSWPRARASRPSPSSTIARSSRAASR